MAWRIQPQVRILPGQNLAAKAFTVETGDFRDILMLDGPDALGGVAIYVAGFKLNKGDEAAPTINWALHAGNADIVDDEPVCTGSTFLVPGKLARQGLLFEVRGRDATTWVLRGYCSQPNDPYILLGSITVSPLPANSSGQLTITAGTVIG
jgi:hypothetical protein